MSSRTRRGAGGRDGPVLGGTQVEGRQAVRELLLAGRRPVRRLFLAPEPSGRPGPLAEIEALARSPGVAVHRVTREEIAALARSEAPQGVVAMADPLPEASLASLARADHPFIVVLDGLTDPQNLGAILRSALGAGATGAVVGRHRSASLGPAALKAAAGAAEHLPIAPVAGIPAALATLRQAGVWVVGLEGAAAGAIWDLPVAGEAVAVVLGSEGRGLSPLVRARCDLLAAIPMAGPLGSLNVSAAAAVACFEVARRRRTRP